MVFSDTPELIVAKEKEAQKNTVRAIFRFTMAGDLGLVARNSMIRYAKEGVEVLCDAGIGGLYFCDLKNRKCLMMLEGNKDDIQAILTKKRKDPHIASIDFEEVDTIQHGARMLNVLGKKSLVARICRNNNTNVELLMSNFSYTSDIRSSVNLSFGNVFGAVAFDSAMDSDNSFKACKLDDLIAQLQKDLKIPLSPETLFKKKAITQVEVRVDTGRDAKDEEDAQGWERGEKEGDNEESDVLSTTQIKVTTPTIKDSPQRVSAFNEKTSFEAEKTQDAKNESDDADGGFSGIKTKDRPKKYKLSRKTQVFQTKPLGFRIQEADSEEAKHYKNKFKYVCIPTSSTEMLANGIVAGSAILKIGNVDITKKALDLVELAELIGSQKMPLKMIFGVKK